MAAADASTKTGRGGRVLPGRWGTPGPGDPWCEVRCTEPTRPFSTVGVPRWGVEPQPSPALLPAEGRQRDLRRMGGRKGPVLQKLPQKSPPK